MPFLSTAGSANFSLRKNYVVQIIVQNFSFTGLAQTYTVPVTGTYKLEAWGAQGGTTVGSWTSPGGKGGYSYGEISLTAGSTLWVYVGGQGNGGTSSTTSLTYVSGGFNGGGRGSQGIYGGDSCGAGGGGATDFRITADLRQNRVIVAGGGGGGGGIVQNNVPGVGGGSSGADGSSPYGAGACGKGGTQLAGGQGGLNIGTRGLSGSLGLGGGAPTTSNFSYSGGGAGYYGGGCSGDGAAPGGGSSYIGGVTSGGTVDGTGTQVAPGGGTQTGHSGNGYARLTLL